VIRCLATEEGQAGNTYDGVYYNLTEGPLSEGLSANAAGLTRTFLPLLGVRLVPASQTSRAPRGDNPFLRTTLAPHSGTQPELPD